MADEWYSDRQQSRWSQEHRELLSNDAKMIDLDTVLWLPYVGEVGTPLMLVERKPENARENGWSITRALAALAGIPALLVVELNNGYYRVYGATPGNRYHPRQFHHDITMLEWYEEIEKPLRDRHKASHTFESLADLLDG